MIKTLYPTFQHWSEKGSVYILSDLHLNDKETKMMNPYWIDVDDQLNIINNRVWKNDTLILLGDHGDPDALRKIKCHNIISVYGNHDKPSDYRGIFAEEYTGPLFISDKILLSHEPINGLPFCLNIHGHAHGGIKFKFDVSKPKLPMTHLNMAADVVGYHPISLGAEIKNGLLSGIPGIHRITIDDATARKLTQSAH